MEKYQKQSDRLTRYQHKLLSLSLQGWDEPVHISESIVKSSR